MYPKTNKIGGDEHENLFIYGDIRGNEQIGLASMHIIFIIAKGIPTDNMDMQYFHEFVTKKSYCSNGG